jgi:branched-subunit amino acid ABC-type transport system permease component
MWGSLVGGLTLGVVIDVVQAFTTSQIAYAAAFLILVPVLVFRPEGVLK